MIEDYPKGIAGFKRLTEELDKNTTVVDQPDAIDVANLQGAISYQEISFSYADHTKVLDHLNLDIPAGETVAFGFYNI